MIDTIIRRIFECKVANLRMLNLFFVQPLLVTASRTGPATTGYRNAVIEDGKRPVRVWTTESDVSETEQAPISYRDTVSEAGIWPIRFRDVDVSEIRETAAGY